MQLVRKLARAPLSQFIALAAVLCLTLFAVLIAVQDAFARKQAEEEYLQNAQLLLADRSEELEHTLELYRSKVRFLHSTPPIKGILRASQNDGIDPYDGTSLALWQERLQIIFESYISANPEVHQIRYLTLDERGKELVRVERRQGQIVRVESNDLQEKGHRAYIERLRASTPGEVYVSDFNLNREHDRIEFPYRPTLRVGEAAFYDDGRPFGAIVINFDAAYLLSTLSANMLRNFQLFVTNPDGGFVLHPEEQWHFAFEFESDRNWPNRYESSFNKEKQWLDVQDRHLDQQLYELVDRVWLAERSEGRYVDLHVMVPSKALAAKVAEERWTNVALLGATLLVVFILITAYQANISKKIKLMHEQAAFKAIVESSTDAIVAMDVSGTVESWNAAAERIFHIPERSAVGNSIFHFLIKSEAGIFTRETLEKVHNGLSVDTFDTEVSLVGNEARVMSVTLSPIIHESGRTLGVAAILRDVTEQREIESKILNMNVALEQQVAERTKELEQARNEALAASKTKSEFIANVSHEIRTPMHGVLGTLNILQREALSEKQHRLVRMAEGSAQALTGLINDILDLSKIEAGKLEMEHVEYNVLRLLSDISASFSVSTYAKGLEFVLDLAGVEHEVVIGDQNRLRQVVMNLLSNALKFTNEGEICLAASTRVDSEGRVELYCEVRDTGVGIAADKLEHLFDAFTQEDSSTSRQYGGTGLGLNISRRLCEMMGGGIGVQSTKGEGSCFNFTLLLEHQDQGFSAFSANKFVEKRLLLLSQSESLSRAIGEQLHRWSAECRVCRSREELNAFMPTLADIDIVLIDDQFSESTSDLCRALQENARMQGVVAFLRSPNCRQLELENVAQVEKPVSPYELWKLMLAEPGKLASRLPIASELRDKRKKPATLMGRCITALVVDDNPVNLEVASDLLDEMGVKVCTAEGGTEAIQRLLNDETVVDLVLMDCQMPGMNGYDTTVAIRNGDAGEKYRAIPIIAMTADAMAGTKEQCLHAGMNDYLSKPFALEEFEAKILSWAARVKHDPTPMGVISAGENSIKSPVSVAPSNTGSAALLSGAGEQWNEEALLVKMRGRVERVERLVRTFKSSLEEQLPELERCTSCRSSDHEAILFLAHAIKGGAGNIEARAVADRAERVETALHEKNIEQAQLALAGLIDDCHALLATFERYLGAQPGAREGLQKS